ncbi:glycoside hydrolase family 1 protein [Microbacterium terricola]|uniref:Beta-glucosidase n=1 Tax=Microbacterium terricola TaxID=344163 RepID=A0ABM8E3E6_9MICO|nr:glycoside hydrolase family 1 protein [Microbacterium terricola]UYK40026.1 glycoside hydrolase family 1 protein [Microbacterium terricola]BDV32282.1 beta-glucosidase [Microbacterium terricola]
MMEDGRDFPEEFLWGAATAAHQVEGSNVNSDWWAFEHDPHTASVESSGDGIDHYARFADDFALLASLGHTAHRLSIEWARIEPAPGEFSAAQLAHYRRVLTAVRDNGMTAFVTLHHFTLPRWFADRGGWTAPDAIDRFEQYVRHVCVGLGDLLEHVCTINEPQMVALHGYLEGYHPPGVTNPTLWKRVGRTLLAAHRAAVRIVHETTGATTGLVVQLPLLAPAREDDVTGQFCAQMQAEIVDLYIDGLAADPVDAGDWLGVQYYRKNWVDPASPTIFAPPPPGVPTTQMGWAIHPDGLRVMLHRAADARLPIYVTENGIATEDDLERISYLDGHLRAVAAARAEGVDVRGYLHWSAFDNFEWSEGYRPKFGLIAVDRHHDYARTPKPSAHALARVARTGRIDALHDQHLTPEAT